MNNGMPWIKHYTKLLTDIRYLRASDNARGVYSDLLLLAGICDANGAFIISGEQLTEDEIAKYISREAKIVRAALKELQKNKLISVNGHGPFVADFQNDQVSQNDRREAWRKSQSRHRGVSDDKDMTDDNVSDDTSVTPAPRVRVQSKNQSKRKIKNQPSPTPSTNKATPSGRRAGKKDDEKKNSSLTFQNLKGKQRKRADKAVKILGSLGIRNPKLETTATILATRPYKNDEQMFNEMFAAIASAYADPTVRSKEAVAINRIETGKIPQSFIEDRTLWRSVPVKTLELAGIDIHKNDKYQKSLNALRERGLAE